MKIIFTTIILILFSGCVSNSPSVFDISQYNKKIFQKIDIPSSCKKEYDDLIPSIAISDISNNSTFNKADINSSISQKDISLNAGVNPVFVGVEAKNHNIKYQTKKKVDAKLSKTLVSLLETTILQVGGIRLYTREDLNKVDKELKLQDSGLLDEDTLVQVGKLAGVEYILTGSIDNISQKYRDYSAISRASVQIAKHTDNDKLKLGSMLATIVTSSTDGMQISTKATIKLIKVSTAEIVFSKDIQDTVNIGKIPNPTFDQIIGAVKEAIANALPTIKQELAKYLQTKAYITQIRQNSQGDMIAQISLSKEDNARANNIFSVYDFDEFIDPLNNKKKCDMMILPLRLITTNQISSSGTWAKVIDTTSNTQQIKLNQLVKRVKIK